MTPADKLTIEGAQAAASALIEEAKAILIRKRDLPGREVIRSIFDALHAAGLAVPSGSEIEQYSHAVGPFVIIAEGLQPVDFLATVAHECEHVFQFWSGEYKKGETVGNTLDGGVAFAWLYLVEPEARVRFEARAYRASLEVYKMLKAPLPPIDHIASALARGYALDKAHVLFGRQLLESAYESVRNGVFSTRSGVLLENVLRRHSVIT